NVGKTVAEIHIGKAKKEMKQLADGPPDPDLAYFVAGTPGFSEYREDLDWCQQYAGKNRQIMMERVLRQLGYALGLDADARQLANELGQEGDVVRLGITVTVHCDHNYVADERHYGEKLLVTRKGAIRAAKGELGIIPGSMGTGSFIVRGLGNPEAFESAPHGAGRRMSRGEAKRRFSCDDLARQTE